MAATRKKSTGRKKTTTRKKTGTRKKTTTGKKTTTRKKTGTRKKSTGGKKAAGGRKKAAGGRKKSGGRKYGPKAQKKVERAMKERNEGKLKSGRSGKRVTSRKQAIAIGLSEARKEGAKVPSRKKSS